MQNTSMTYFFMTGENGTNRSQAAREAFVLEQNSTGTQSYFISVSSPQTR
jgi:hypothetical protein